MYQEVTPAEFDAGAQIVSDAAMGKIPRYADADFNLLFQFQHMYEDWRSWRVTLDDGTIYVHAVELLTWLDARRRDPPAINLDALRERGYRLRTLRQVPACLITTSDRARLMERAARGEVVYAATGEKNTARYVWIVEGERWQPLWEGSEKDWRRQLCDPARWPPCKNICHRRSYLDSI